MKKKIRVIAILVALCTFSTTSIAIADDLSDAKSKSETIEQQIEENKSQIEELEKNKASILDEISSLDNEIQPLYDEVNQLNSQIEQSTEKIAELDEKTIELEEEIKTTEDVMNKRFRVMYQNNGAGYLEVLLEANGFGDFLRRLDTVTTLIHFNNDIMTEYKNNQKELEETLIAVNEEKTTLETAKGSVDSSIATLEIKKSEKKELMAKAESDIEQAEAILAQTESEFNEIVASIESMEVQAARPSRGESTSSSTVSTNGMFSISKTRYPITSGFVDRVNPVTGANESHKGIDIGAPYGDPVYSLMGGVVTYAGWMTGYGNVVVVNHGSMSTLYAHNSSLTVSVGQTVSGGQQVSVVGSTGLSTGPHIHFEVIIGGTRIDPTGYYF